MNLSCTVLLFQKAITIYISIANVSEPPLSISLLETAVTFSPSNKYRMIVHGHCHLHESVSKIEHIVINSMSLFRFALLWTASSHWCLFFFLLDCFSPSDELVRSLHDYYIISNCPPNNRLSIYFIPDTFYHTNTSFLWRRRCTSFFYSFWHSNLCFMRSSNP